MENIDLLITPSWIIPVIPEGTVLSGHSIAIHEGVILAIGPSEDLKNKFSAKESLELNGQAILPGFINAHCHAAMSLLRGYADDTPLQVWLNEYIWPAEGQWVSESFVNDGTELACAEMILSGTTTFNDMYFYPNVVAQVVKKSHMRASLSFPFCNFQVFGLKTPMNTFIKACN